MEAPSTLERIRRDRHQQWLAALRQRAEEEGRRCREQGIALDAVLLFGSRARGDHDGLSDTDLIVVGRSARDAAAAADRLAAARLGDDLIPLSHQAWIAKRHSPDPYWRTMAAEAIPLYESRARISRQP